MSTPSLTGTDRVRLVPTRLARTLVTSAMLAVAGLSLFAVPASAQNAKVIINSFRPGLIDAGIAVSQILTNEGLIVDLVDAPYPSFGYDIGDLADYECVWDLRVDEELQPIDESRLSDYMIGGGGLYLAGEHGVFTWRNNDVTALLSSLGGGAISIDPTPPPGVIPLDTPEPTNLAHPINNDCESPITEVVYSGIGSGSFLSLGTGTWLTGSPTRAGAAAWDPGSLSMALDAHVVVGLDINYLSPGAIGTLDFHYLDPTLPTQNRAFVTNMAKHICGIARPIGVVAPRNHGYWHRYCLGTDTVDPGRNGGGNGPDASHDTATLPANLLAMTDADLAPYGVTSCAALVDGHLSDPREAALREYATIRLNINAGYLSCNPPIELHPVDNSPNLTVSDALMMMMSALAGTDEDALRDATWIGEHVNNGEAILR